MYEQKEEGVIRKIFSFYYFKQRNIREAGIKAGFSDKEAFSEGMKLLEQTKTKSILKKMSKKALHQEELVKAGLERLAFGSINDVAQLVFMEDIPSKKELSELDLFNVSEIKKVKGGGVEVKFFDRQKALEKLWEIDSTSSVNSSAESFFNAIKAGAETSAKTEEG